MVGEPLLPAGHGAGSRTWWHRRAPEDTQGRGPLSPGMSQWVQHTGAGVPGQEGMKAAASSRNPAWTIL